jgi:membrane-bound metal-dependent hydrolase YbcI (DUF457 family)
MASYKGHLVGGAICTGIYTAAISFAPVEQFAEYAHVLKDWQALVAVFIIGMLFALFPDVDTKSKGQYLFYWTLFPVDVLLIYSGNLQAAAYLGLVGMLPVLAHHRGWTHSKWAMVLIPLPIILVPYLYSDKVLAFSLVLYGAAVVGYFSHLLLDGLIWRHFRIKA